MIRGIPKGYRRSAGAQAQAQAQRLEGDAMSQTVEELTPTSAEYRTVTAEPKESPRTKQDSVNGAIASKHDLAEPTTILAVGGTTAGAALVGGILLWPVGAITGTVIGLLLGLRLVLQKSHK